MADQDNEMLIVLKEIRDELRHLNRKLGGKSPSESIPEANEVLTVQEVAGELGVHRNTAYSYCKKGHFPNAWKLPGDRNRAEWRVPRADLVAFKAPKKPQPYDKKRVRKMLAQIS